MSDTNITVICNKDEYIDVLYSMAVSTCCPFHEKFCDGIDLLEDMNTVCMKCINRHVDFLLVPDAKPEVNE